MVVHPQQRVVGIGLEQPLEDLPRAAQLAWSG